LTPSESPGRRRRPYSWVEFLALVLGLGVLAGVLVPRAQEARERNVAVQAVSDFDTLRRAAFDYVSAHGAWPADAGPGEVPPGLEPFLPTGFRFTTEEYELDWDHWRLPEGLPRHPEIRTLVGISLTTDLPRVAEALGRAQDATNGVWYGLGNRYTYVLERP